MLLRLVKGVKNRSIDRKMAVIKKYWRDPGSAAGNKKAIETFDMNKREKVLFLHNQYFLQFSKYFITML